MDIQRFITDALGLDIHHAVRPHRATKGFDRRAITFPSCYLLSRWNKLDEQQHINALDSTVPVAFGESGRLPMLEAGLGLV